MTRVSWDDRGYTMGIDRGVITIEGVTVPWNGLISVEIDEGDKEIGKVYLDGLPIVHYQRTSNISGKVNAFDIPSLLIHDSQNGLITSRYPRSFSFSYREKTRASYRIHILYNVKLQPNDKAYIYDEATVATYSFVAKPVLLSRMRPASHFIIDAPAMDPLLLMELEERLYGSVAIDAYIPDIETLLSLFPKDNVIIVTDFGDGRFEIEAPDHILQMVAADTFEIDHDDVKLVGDGAYTVEST